MKLTITDFASLVDAVEASGGALLDDTCHADEITYEYPDGTNKISLTTGCERETVFDVPYDPSEAVLVPEPLLEPDPDRPEWTDDNGDPRVPRRAQKERYMGTDGKEYERVLFEIVERPGEKLLGDEIIDRATVRVCALDDNVGMWPRFKHAVTDPRSK